MRIILSLLFILSCCGGPSDEDAPQGPERGAGVRRGGGAGGGLVSVASEPVVREDLLVQRTYTGELLAESADLAFQAAGRLVEVGVRIGDQVSRGQELARLEDTTHRQELAEARAQLGVALAGVNRASTEAELAERELERLAPLARQEMLSEHEMDSRRAAVEALGAELAVSRARVAEAEARVARLQQRLKDARILSPVDGVVAERYLDPGGVVSAGTPVLRVVEGGPLRIRFRVPENELSGMVPGLPLTISAGGMEEGVPGILERVAGAVSPVDRAMPAEGLLEPHEELRPGMFARVTVQVEELPMAMVIPGVAVLDEPPGDLPAPGVFTVEDGAARWVPVDVLARHEDKVAVSGELDEGQPVLVLGHQRLRNGSPVKLDERHR